MRLKRAQNQSEDFCDKQQEENSMSELTDRAIQAIEIERDTLDVRLKSLSIYDIGVRVLTAYGPPPASFDVYKPVPKISDVTQPARLRRQQYEPPKLQNK